MAMGSKAHTLREQCYPQIPWHEINMQNSGQGCKNHRKFKVVFRSHLNVSVNVKARALISDHHSFKEPKLS